MTQPPTVPGQPQPTPYGPPAPAAPKPSRAQFWLRGPGLVLVIVVAGLAVFGIYALAGGLTPGSAKADDLSVTVTRCEFTDGSLPSAVVGISVTNGGSATHSAVISIEYRDGGGARIDTDTARVSNVRPGETVRTEETTLLDAAASSGTCVLTGIR